MEKEEILLGVFREQYIKDSKRNSNLDTKSSILATLTGILIIGYNTFGLEKNIILLSFNTFLFLFSNILFLFSFVLFILNYSPREYKDFDPTKYKGTYVKKDLCKELISDLRRFIGVLRRINKDKAEKLKIASSYLILAIICLIAANFLI